MKATIDAHVNTAGREGLTGTAPANVYGEAGEPEEITRPPDADPFAAVEVRG